MRTQIQGDSRWANEKLGHSNETIRKSGCFLVSLANMCDKTPSEVNKILTDNGLINSEGMLTDKIRIAQVLGLEYHGASSVQPNYPCIAETAHFASRGVPQHFYIINPDGSQIDPLGYSIEYKVKSYRLFKAREDYMDEETANHMRRHLVFLVWPIILGRSADEKTIQENADWIKRDSEGSFNYKGMAEWVANLYNSPEAVEYRKKQCVTSGDKYVTMIGKIKEIIKE